jgi:hypothetical protein
MYPGLENQQQNLLSYVIAALGATLEVRFDSIVRCPAPTRYLIKLDKIVYDGATFELRSPITLALYEDRENSVWMCESKEFDIIAAGDTREQAVRSFSEDFSVLWDEIAQCPDDSLTVEAQDLKRHLLSTVRSVTKR